MSRLLSSHLVAIVMAILSLMVSGFVGYSHNDKDLAQRVTAVETQQKNDHEGINRVDESIHRVDAKVDKLLDWALGKH
jgi:hypothetical protein